MRFSLSVCAAMFFGLLPPLHAQPLNCMVSTDAVTSRVEGVTDPIGDVFIQCAANDRTPAGQAYITGDVKIFINTNIVNRLLAGGATDVVLIVNENHAPPTSASTLGGPMKNFPVPQFGQIVAANALQWSAVKIPTPGATAPDGSVFPSRTTLRITNMRVNGAQLGLSSTPVPTQVLLYATTIADAAAVPITNPQQTLTFLAQGLITVGASIVLLPQCQSQNIVNGAVNGPPSFSVRLKEGFEYAFRPLGQPTTDRGIRRGEDGYPTPGIGLNGGGADQGTRLLVRLNNIGAGVRIAVPATITNGTLSLQLLLNNDLTGAGPYQPAAGNGLVELAASTGTAIAVYEVVKSDNLATESVDIPFVVGYTANPVVNLPGPGATSVNASFAPLTTNISFSSTAPFPRFADGSFARNAFAIVLCTGPPPLINAVTPKSLPAATGMDAVLRVDGSGFDSDSIVEWNGTALRTMLGRDANVFLSALVTASLTMQLGTAQLDVSNADGQRSNRVVFTITGTLPPAVNSGGAVNAASSQAILTRGGLASLYGIALATSTASASGFPLPPVLANVKVTVNGRAAPLIYVSPSQINFQVPFEVPLTGTATIVVTRDGINSAAATAGLAEFAPGIFRASIGPILLHSDYSLVTPAKPAAPGEVLIAYGTGLGGLNSPPATGSATPANPVVTARLLPAITIGGQTAEVQFAGLASGFAGLAQFNFRVPRTLPPGSLQILVLGYGSNTDSVPLAVLNSATGQITSLNPSSAPALSSGINLTVNGTGLTNSAVVQWTQNGPSMNLSTTFVNSSMLTARIPGNLLTGQGTAIITVLNGNGSSSNALTFTITITPPPALGSLNPSYVVAGATGFTLAVTGTNFTPGSVVRWNGVALPTTFVSGTKLFAAVSNSAVSSVSTAGITVADAGVTSNLLNVAIVGSFGASFSNQRVTKEAPPASGCIVPAAQTSFSVTAGTVFLYYEAIVAVRDSFNNDWLAPDGTVVPDSSWTPTHGNFCFIGGMLTIPSSPLGAWEGRVFENGALLFAVPFTIVGSTAAGDSHN